MSLISWHKDTKSFVVSDTKYRFFSFNSQNIEFGICADCEILLLTFLVISPKDIIFAK